METDFNKCRTLDKKYKVVLGEILYDSNLEEKIFPEQTAKESDKNVDNPGPHLNFEAAKLYIENYLK